MQRGPRAALHGPHKGRLRPLTRAPKQSIHIYIYRAQGMIATHFKRPLFRPNPSSFRIPDAVLSQGTQTSGCVFCSTCWVGCCSATRTRIGDARRKWNDRNRRDHLKNTAGAPSDKAEAYRRSVREWQGRPACCDRSRNRHT